MQENNIVQFPAKYIGKCINGHKVNVGDYIAYDKEDGVIYCVSCEFFKSITKKQEVLYSNKFCNDCHLELAMDGTCGNCG